MKDSVCAQRAKQSPQDKLIIHRKSARPNAGMIEPEAIYTHPMRNQIYRFLGEKPEVEVDTATVPLGAEDCLLVCSDGLWEMVHDPQIAAILATPTSDPSLIASALIQAALAGGGVDNISAIVAQMIKEEEKRQERF